MVRTRQRTVKPSYVLSDNLALLPHVVHGFFGRDGGNVSKTLNCGYGSGDEEDNISKNRYLAVRTIGLLDNHQLCVPSQIHSNVAVITNSPWKTEQSVEADALVTNTPNLALGVITADCAPVLLADSEAYVAAAVHAGWKGAYHGIIENTLKKMESLGSTISNVCATIGPTISQQSYEVGPEFFERFIQQSDDNSQFFIPSEREHYHMFDLPGYIIARLRNNGIRIRNIRNVKKDTFTLEKEYFSYRRTCLQGESICGRNISLISLKP